MNVGKTIKTIREEQGLSRRELAEKLGIKPSSLWKVETAHVYPKKATIDKSRFYFPEG